MNKPLRNVWDNINKSNIYVNGVQEERQNDSKNM